MSEEYLKKKQWFHGFKSPSVDRMYFIKCPVSSVTLPSYGANSSNLSLSKAAEKMVLGRSLAEQNCRWGRRVDHRNAGVWRFPIV